VERRNIRSGAAELERQRKRDVLLSGAINYQRSGEVGGGGVANVALDTSGIIACSMQYTTA
jgi:hypothetical protein